MARNDSVQKRSGGGVERRRTVPLWGPLTLVVVVAVGSLLVMQVQTLPDPLPESAFAPLPERGAPIDVALAHAGEELFSIHCSACHRAAGTPTSQVGPSLVGITTRRPLAWIRGMVQEPDSMHRVDPLARQLLLEWRVPMRDVGLREPAFRAILEYMRLRDRPVTAEAPARYGPAPSPLTSARTPKAATRAAPLPDTTAEAAVPYRGEVMIDTVPGSQPDPGPVPPLPRPDTLGGDRTDATLELTTPGREEPRR